MNQGFIDGMMGGGGCCWQALRSSSLEAGASASLSLACHLSCTTC
ncbi:hypothetical protein NC652_033849 [Populus alba x Populus x berolinensis]|uniref:Uncharacterized protein n=1 Tax=Populus alba x Populus x berolinensis TaxID=444605 RepID=A0AAD6LXC3_9ROSI|nr:hypothetical protein NC652_033843 [Populus alba x Populus x berolinensis]KAJ6880637.1 hypothetical protein NC652_033849 [Populus alba x Populus x berolinensis]KAJ6973547.1 hypothetical protein NC653_033775 [Populus alba x Populus x berolinensis]